MCHDSNHLQRIVNLEHLSTNSYLINLSPESTGGAEAIANRAISRPCQGYPEKLRATRANEGNRCSNRPGNARINEN